MAFNTAHFIVQHTINEKQKQFVNGKAMQYQQTFLPVAAGVGISPQFTLLITSLK